MSAYQKSAMRQALRWPRPGWRNCLYTCPRLRHESLRHDVDVDATEAEHTVVATLLAEETVAVAQLGVGIEIVGVGGMMLQGHPGGKLTGQHTQQTFIVGHEHLHIEVVVPGDETPVAHASYQGARTDPIGYAVTAADGIEHLQHLLHALLVSAEQGAFGVEPCLQLGRVESGVF